MLTSEQKAVLYALRLIKLRWEDEADYAGLVVMLNVAQELGMMRLLDIILLPGQFREVVMWTLQNRGRSE